MYLRKTTTAPLRGLDILNPLYQQLAVTHSNQTRLDVLQVGAGVGVKFLSNYANQSKMIRRFDSLLRSFPLPHKYFASYEPMELYSIISEHGFSPRLRVADINPNVLSVVQGQQSYQQMAFELTDISNISKEFVTESYDVCIALNVLPHLPCPNRKRSAIRNLIDLTKEGGYIVGIPIKDGNGLSSDNCWHIEKIDNLLYRKQGTS